MSYRVNRETKKPRKLGDDAENNTVVVTMYSNNMQKCCYSNKNVLQWILSLTDMVGMWSAE